MDKPPIKPDIMNLIEALDRSGLPLVAGGYMDQPYLLMTFIETAKGKIELMEHLNRLAAKNSGE